MIRNGVEPFPDSVSGEEATEIRKELGIEADHLVVGMVANFNRSVKGVSRFLDAVPEIVRAVPSARFLLLGRGKEEKALREKARALGMEPYVLFAGFKPDIHRYYAIMDVSALTSFSEGLSITLLESMRCGVPVVATRVGGNPEVVVRRRDGVPRSAGGRLLFCVQNRETPSGQGSPKANGGGGAPACGTVLSAE